MATVDTKTIRRLAGESPEPMTLGRGVVLLLCDAADERDALRVSLEKMQCDRDVWRSRFETMAGTVAIVRGHLVEEKDRLADAERLLPLHIANGVARLTDALAMNGADHVEAERDVLIERTAKAEADRDALRTRLAEVEDALAAEKADALPTAEELAAIAMHQHTHDARVAREAVQAVAAHYDDLADRALAKLGSSHHDHLAHQVNSWRRTARRVRGVIRVAMAAAAKPYVTSEEARAALAAPAKEAPRCRADHCTNTATHGLDGEATACWQHAGDWPRVEAAKEPQCVACAMVAARRARGDNDYCCALHGRKENARG